MILVFNKITPFCYEDVKERAYIDLPDGSGRKYLLEFTDQSLGKDKKFDTFEDLLSYLITMNYSVLFFNEDNNSKKFKKIKRK